MKIKGKSRILSMFVIYVITTCFNILFPLTAVCQNNEKEMPMQKGSSVEIKAEYNSDSGLFGIFNNAVTQSTTGPSLTYLGAKGLCLVASGYSISHSNHDFTQSTSEFDISAGWNFYLFDDILAIEPSYSHFFISSAGNSTQSYFKDLFEVSTEAAFNWFKPSFTVDYLPGKNSTFNFNLTAATSFELFHASNKGSTLTIEPAIAINYGDNILYNIMTNFNLRPLATLRTKYGDNITIGEILANNTIGKNKQTLAQLKRLSSGATLGQILNKSSSSGINSLEFCFPLLFDIHKLSFRTALNVSVPKNVPSYLEARTKTFFSGSVAYNFDW